MTDPVRHRLTALLFVTVILARPAAGQNLPPATPNPPVKAPSVAPPSAPSPENPVADASLSASLPPPLFDLKDSDIKFRLQDLLSVLRDRNHEGWVLAAYPDPATSRPLIGAGFGLDVAATDHPQLDTLNPHLFLEPSSAQLWQAAGLEPERLQRILDQYDRNLEAWAQKGYRRKIRAHSLPPDLTEAEANSLLRISAIQAIHNARAYCP